MKTVPLGGKIAAGRVALVDDADYELVSRYRWHIVLKRSRSGQYESPYAQTSIRRPDGRWTTIKMHNVIMDSKGVDHRNRDGLDNQRANLRVATQSQNAANQGPRVGTSSYKGVSWTTRNQKWCAQIGTGLRGRVRFLGYFAAEEDAARAYDAAAREVYGPFARLNFREDAGDGPGRAEGDRIHRSGVRIRDGALDPESLSIQGRRP
jgi:hypothetical protein